MEPRTFDTCSILIESQFTIGARGTIRKSSSCFAVNDAEDEDTFFTAYDDSVPSEYVFEGIYFLASDSILYIHADDMKKDK